MKRLRKAMKVFNKIISYAAKNENKTRVRWNRSAVQEVFGNT